MSEPASRPRSGLGRLLRATYALLALAAGARAAVQIGADFGRAPGAYLLTACAAAVYALIAATILSPGPARRRIALVACSLELAGVLGVGMATSLWPGAFPDETVWSGFGAGYGWVPLLLPALGIAWLLRSSPPMSEPAGETMERLQAGLDRVLRAPADDGRIELIVARPAEEERVLLERASFEPGRGLTADTWSVRPTRKTGAPNPDAEVTLMSSRAAALVAGSAEPESWAPAGDQLYADLDIGVANLPAGSRLAVGSAVLEVTAEPHLGCGKFIRRYGTDAMKLVNSERGRELRLRGVNLRVVEAGEAAVGDRIRRLEVPAG